MRLFGRAGRPSRLGNVHRHAQGQERILPALSERTERPGVVPHDPEGFGERHYFSRPNWPI